MSGFAAEWLSLRETADRRARNARLLTALGGLFHDYVAPRILDLGAGTGANMRALAPYLPPGQIWTLLDADESLLSRARAPAGIAFGTCLHDLAEAPPDLAGQDLVVCTAFLDLVSSAWAIRLADSLAAARLPFHAALSYDGTASFDPTHRQDEAMRNAVNAHQTGEKGFGPALGPSGADYLANCLEHRGFIVEIEPSPWRLGADDSALLAAFVEDWAEAARDMGVDSTEWLAFRRKTCDQTSAEIGHVDLLAIPAD